MTLVTSIDLDKAKAAHSELTASHINECCVGAGFVSAGAWGHPKLLRKKLLG